MSYINWVKTHKFIVALVLIIAFLLLKQSTSQVGFPSARSRIQPAYPPDSLNELPSAEINSQELGAPSVSKDYAPPPADEKVDRLVEKNSNLSLLVEDVRGTGEKIISHAENEDGYMVSASYNRPDQSPFATITVRVPIAKLDGTLSFFRSLAIKVTSENLIGRDVTEEFTDIEARIATLEKTKAKFEEILEKATQVQDILTVQREIINTQRQIDSLKGQSKAIEQNANLSKVTIYLSTDELALPYTPDKTFRPNVVFKQAVRSMLGTLRSGANTLIWVGVYSVIWVPLLVIFYIYKKRKNRKSNIES